MTTPVKGNRLKLVVFVGNRKALERWDMVEGTTVLLPAHPSGERVAIINAFNAAESGILVIYATASFMAAGYHVIDENTMVVFDTSWPYAPNDPITIQAKARVRKIPRESTQAAITRFINP